MKGHKALLLTIVLTLSSLITVESAFAQSISKPTVPDFTLKFVAHPYDVLPRYETNPYTGKNEMTESGYHVENKSIDVIIKNQPFTSTLDENGEYANLYYFVRFKGLFADEWGYWGYYPNNPDDNNSTAIATPVNASQSEYTTITLGLDSHRFGKVPVNSEIDFQVEAFIGYEKRVDFFFLGGESHYYVFSTFERSGWSNTQTIEIPASGSPSSSSSSQTSSPDQTKEITPNQTTGSNSQETPQTWQSATVVGGIAGIILVIAVSVSMVYFKKRKRAKQT